MWTICFGLLESSAVQVQQPLANGVALQVDSHSSEWLGGWRWTESAPEYDPGLKAWNQMSEVNSELRLWYVGWSTTNNENDVDANADT